jgi:hypothetical protein
MIVMLELGGNGAVAVIRSVPAERCVNCGKGYLTEDTAERVESITEELRAAGVELAVREYEAAA